MAGSTLVAIGKAAMSALSKTALILDDIPATAANLMEVPVKKTHPDHHPHLLPSLHKGKHMSEGEFYRKAAAASLAPKTIIGLGLGTAAGALSFVGLSSVLTIGLVPLALWICGKGTEKEGEHEHGKGEYEATLTDKVINLTPGVKKFINRLPEGHRRILSETIKMDVALEMEMMTLAAVALGAGGLATTGIIGFCATVAIVPVVAVAATTVVWSTALGVRKLRHLIGKNQKAIDAGTRQEKPFDKVLNLIDRKIEPALGLIGKLALMAIGGALLVEHAFIPLAQMAMPHLAASVVPMVESAIHGFETLPGLAQTVLSAPLGFSIGKFVYNPLIAPAMGAIKRGVGSFFKRAEHKENSPGPAPAAPAIDIAPAAKVGMAEPLREAFSTENTKAAAPIQSAPAPQAGQLAPESPH